MKISEDEIIQYLQEDAKKGIELIYDKWGAALYGIICQICDDEVLAQDVLQDVMVSIWKHSNKYDRKKAKLFTWIYRITKNKAIDAQRKLSKSRICSIDQNGELVSSHNVSSIVENSDLSLHLDKLEPKYKEILRALFYRGLSQKECSEILDIPLGTVKSRLRIALRELRKVYAELPISILLIVSIYG